MHPCALHRFVGRCRPPPHALMGRCPSSTSETIHRSPVCGGGGQGRPSPWWSCRRRRPRARHEPPGINDTRGCAGHPCVTDRDHGVVLGPNFDYGGGTVGTPMLGQKGVYTARSSSEALASGSSGGLYAETWRAPGRTRGTTHGITRCVPPAQAHLTRTGQGRHVAAPQRPPRLSPRFRPSLRAARKGSRYLCFAWSDRRV